MKRTFHRYCGTGHVGYTETTHVEDNGTLGRGGLEVLFIDTDLFGDMWDRAEQRMLQETFGPMVEAGDEVFFTDQEADDDRREIPYDEWMAFGEEAIRLNREG